MSEIYWSDLTEVILGDLDAFSLAFVLSGGCWDSRLKKEPGFCILNVVLCVLVCASIFVIIPVTEVLMSGSTFLSSDYRGGFQLQAVQDLERDRQLMQELERLRLTGLPTGKLPAPRAFTPLLDIPVDSYISGSIRQRSLSPPRPDQLLDESPHSTERRGRSPKRQERDLPQMASHGNSTPERGRSPYRNGHDKATRARSGNGREVKYTVMSAHRRSRTPLTQVFGPDVPRNPMEREQANGHTGSTENLQNSLPGQEYELTTVFISKCKQSLGECAQAVWVVCSSCFSELQHS